jgi:hypothetical protein
VEQAIKDYLKQLTKENIGSSHNQTVENSKLVDFVAAKLTRQKFRKRPLVPETLETIKRKVSISIKKQRPIHLIIPFGGYKHFWNASYPHPNWAEIFHFHHITEYLEPILATYEPGVLVEYVSEDLIVPRMNNYPPKALEIYADDFRKLLSQMQKATPQNLELRFWRVSEKYDSKKIIAEVEQALPSARQNWEKLSKENRDWQLIRSQRSVFWNGNKDLSSLTKTEKQKRIIESRLIEVAYFDSLLMQPMMKYYDTDDHVMITFSWGMSKDNSANYLTLGSVQSSNVDFWIGTGMLEQRENEQIVPRIISQNQFYKVEKQLEIKKTGISLIPSLATIPVFKGKLDFN